MNHIFYAIFFLSIGSLQAVIFDACEKWGTLPTASQSSTRSIEVVSRLPKSEQIVLSAAPSWNNALHASVYKGMKIVHFKLHANDVDGDDIAITFYLATTAQQKVGTYQCKVVMKQSRNHYEIRLCDAQNKVITGSVPYIHSPDETTHVPNLPWRDGMSLWYSLLVQVVEGRAHLVLIQHTKDVVLSPAEAYQPASVHDMLVTYAAHSFLADRAHGFFDSVDHFRLLALPYRHEIYAPLCAHDWAISWSVEKGSATIFPIRGK